jgi:hypothetical protein
MLESYVKETFRLGYNLIILVNEIIINLKKILHSIKELIKEQETLIQRVSIIHYNNYIKEAIT